MHYGVPFWAYGWEPSIDSHLQNRERFHCAENYAADGSEKLYGIEMAHGFNPLQIQRHRVQTTLAK